MCSAEPCRRSTHWPKDLNLASLGPRVAQDHVKEVILALNATVDGQTTAHYITGILAESKVKITRLAHGVPVGGESTISDEGRSLPRSAADAVLKSDRLKTITISSRCGLYLPRVAR